MAAPLTVEIWSDVVCPWCYIGKRRFDRALAELVAGDDDHAPIEVDIVYRPYQLDPTADPNRSGPAFDAYAAKFGGTDQAQQIIDSVTATAAKDGLEFHLEEAQRANTLRAHRLLWLAGNTSIELQAALEERLMSAYFTEGLDIGDIPTLTDLAVDVGLERDQVDALFTGNDGAVEVAKQLDRAAEFGVTAVPTYVVNGQWAIPGAQETETFVRTLRKVASRD